jgi:hypothetical protein
MEERIWIRFQLPFDLMTAPPLFTQRSDQATNKRAFSFVPPGVRMASWPSPVPDAMLSSTVEK